MRSDDGRLIFFNGTVMRGQPAHENLSRAVFLHVMRTAPRYRLYSIRDQYPAMLPTSEEEGVSVTGEVYFVPNAAWPEIDGREPEGLYCGRVELSEGELVYGMLGTPRLVAQQGHDISAAGGWLAHLEQSRT
jgi:gamma-glutamylcyclotransferase (GGCT)/AIG2-like uncharacterized protein YtfP